MNIILRLYFNPVDNIFPENYQGAEYFDIADAAYIPNSGTKVYFDPARYTNDTRVIDGIVEMMDNGGLQISIWRVDYQTNETIVSGSLSRSALLCY